MHLLARYLLAALPLLPTSSAHPQSQPTEILDADLPAPKCKTRLTDFPGFNLTLAYEQDLQSLGPYDIVNCAHHASTARYALSTTQRFAALAASDSLLGPASEFGFTALFKSPNAVPRVHELLNNVAEGSVPYRGGCYPGFRPAVMCINANQVVTRKMRALCNQGYPAFTNTAFPHVVMLCTSVWGLPDIRERNVKCPTLDTQGKLTPNTGALAMNPQALLVHEFLHVYNGVAGSGDEKYNLQDAVDLSEEDSLWNANSYALYVAGESSSSAFLVVWTRFFI